MIGLTATQHSVVAGVFSFTGGVLALAAMWFWLQRGNVRKQHDLPVTILSLVMGWAAYSYVRLHESWTDGFVVAGGFVQPTIHPFNEFYRFGSWLVTAPLLLVAIVLVLNLTAKQRRTRSVVLAMLGAEMIVLSWPGMMARTADQRLLWFAASMVPYVLIWFQLFFTLGRAVSAEPQPARQWVMGARWILFFGWMVYPTIYALPMFGLTSATVYFWTQIGYAAGDLLTKALFGVFLCLVATSKAGIGEPSGNAARAGAPPRSPGRAYARPGMEAVG